MNTVHLQMQKLLIDAEYTLKQSGLWEVNKPSPEALMSTQPFAVDTLHPEQWLQWIFIPKMQQIVSSQQALPVGFAISPYFEQTCQGKSEWAKVIKVLKEIDEVCA
ncbi:YqcC family protein [Vibrio breoganii]